MNIEMTQVAIFIALLFLLSVIGGRLERTVLTAPMLFTAAGMLICVGIPEFRDQKQDLALFRRVAEVGLVLLLFTDASRTDLQVLRRSGNLPIRLLSVGMLLTLLLGTLAALLMFPRLSLWEAGILAAILAPTDAGLGQIIVSSPRVPERIRQALNVEAGLNDGLSVPFLMFFIGLAAVSGAAPQVGLLRVLMEQLGLGTLVGVGIGLVGGWLLGLARRRHWTTDALLQLGLVALPLLCGLVSEEFGASMFIAAFVAGLAVQVGFKEAGQHSIEFGEGWGQIFNLAVFFLFGLMVVRNWGEFTLAMVFYAVLSLTVVRMLPVALALLGSGLSRATVAFIGWFGPRGLASIVLGLFYLESEAHVAGEYTIAHAVMVTVVLSIFAHGLTALPGINLYASVVASQDRGEQGSGLAQRTSPK